MVIAPICPLRSPALGSELALKRSFDRASINKAALDFILANTSAVFDHSRIEIRSEIARCKGIGTNFSIEIGFYPCRSPPLAPTHFRVP
jgi:hypothetical protein